MVLALETYVTRAFDIFDPVVVTVGTFHAGTVDNVIPATAMFDATVRSFSHDVPGPAEHRPRAGRAGRRGGARARRRRATTNGATRSPSTTTTRRCSRPASRPSVFGDDRFAWLDNPGAGSEDISYVLEKVPGAYLNLGACPPGLDPDDGAEQPLAVRAVRRRRGARTARCCWRRWRRRRLARADRAPPDRR